MSMITGDCSIVEAQHRTFRVISPRPCIAIPNVWQEMQWGSLWSAINGGNAAQHIFIGDFGIFKKDIKVTIFGKGLRNSVDQFEFWVLSGAMVVYQSGVGEFDLRILIKHLHIRMAGDIV